MPYWDHKGETQFLASPLCDSYNKGKNARSVFTMDRAFLFYVTPPSPRLS